MTITGEDAIEVVARLSHVPGFEGANLAGPPHPLTGGFWAELAVLSIDVAGIHRQVVLRRMPDVGYGAKEAAFQVALADAGFPVPAVHLIDLQPPSGRPELVMELVSGHPPLAGLDGPSALLKFPVLARRIPDLLAKVMVQLHSIDAGPIADRVLRATSTTPTSLPGVLDGLRQGAEAFERQDLVKVISALRADAPSFEPMVVCHGDLHPFNVLVDEHAWTLLDWTAALLAPPAYDVAFTRLLLRYPPLSAPRALAPLISAGGAAIAHRFQNRYAVTAPRNPSPAELDWYTALHGTRILLEVEGWHHGGAMADHRGHPWLTIGPIAARFLAARTGVEIRWPDMEAARTER